jgi:hypothetical protein
MRQIKAKQIKHAVQEESERRGIPFIKAGYRLSKVVYNKVPRNKRGKLK